MGQVESRRGTSLMAGSMASELAAVRNVTVDAVVILPGIMGSALRETATGRLVWGLEPSLLRNAWQRRDGMRVLHVDEDELVGRTGRIEPDGLLMVPAWASLLRGIEPYRKLLATVCEAVAMPQAVLAFAYDWRLSVAHNGRLLADAARRHLTAWRARVAVDPRLRALFGDRAPRLVFVAHSMGGLVTRAALAHTRDLVPDTRAVVSLGTPFHGSAQAALILNGPRGSRLRRNLHGLAATMPGVHDLLPGHRCLDAGTEVHHLTPADVHAIGGNRLLAAAAADHQRRMREHAVTLPGHRAVVGVAQPTVQSLRLDQGALYPQYLAFCPGADGHLQRDEHGIPCLVDRGGDGTVYRDAAHPGPGTDPVYVPVQHGALVREEFVLGFVRGVLTENDEHPGPLLGAGDIGLRVPEDAVEVGSPWAVAVTGVESPAGLTVAVHDVTTGRHIESPRLVRNEDGDLAARVAVPAPGLYRVTANTGGPSPVTQLVMAYEPDEDAS